MAPLEEAIGLGQDMALSKESSVQLKVSIKNVEKHQEVEKIVEVICQLRVLHLGHMQNAHN